MQPGSSPRERMSSEKLVIVASDFSPGRRALATRCGADVVVELGQGEVVSFGDHRFEVLHCPGHAPGHVQTDEVGTVEDYYRRRNRYLITRVGQEVHDLVEGVLAQVDDVRDVSLGRLEQVRAALER